MASGRSVRFNDELPFFLSVQGFLRNEDYDGIRI